MRVRAHSLPGSLLTAFPLLLVSMLHCALANAEDWPQWRGPARDAKSAQTGISKNWDNSPPKLLWMAEGMGRGYAGVSVSNGVIYTTGNLKGGQGVIAIDAKSGNVLWRKTLTEVVPKHGYQGSRCTPSIDGDRLYVVTSAGSIACLRLKDGVEVWSRKFSDWGGKMMSGWGYSESPLVDGDWVLCTPGGRDAMIVALNKSTGEEVWKSAVPNVGGETASNGKPRKQGAGYASIVVSKAAGVKQYVQLVGQGLVGVRASDGKYLWGYGDIANTTANIPTAIVDGDYVFTSTGYGTGSALLKLSKTADGVEASEEYFLVAKTLENHHGGMILLDGHIYCGHKHNNGFPICVRMKDGEVVWGGNVRGPGSGSAAVLLVDGHLIYRYQSGHVALIEATTSGYKLKGTFMPAHQEDKSWAHPVVVDGKLYLREQDKLMCYDIVGK